MKFVPVLIILCLCHGSCMSNKDKDRASTTQGGKTQDHWTWRITKRPSQSSDGFVHLVSAIEEMRNGQKQESVNEDTIEGILKVADCMLFEGKPNRLYAFGEEYSDRLVGDASEVLFSDLISLGKYSASQGARLLAEERFEDALVLAESMLRLGWLVVANGEDNVLASWRLAMWSNAVNIMNDLAVREDDTAKLQELKDAERSMQKEFEEIRQRSPERLYFPAAAETVSG